MSARPLAKIEFDTDVSRERADSLTSYTRDVIPSGRICWIVPVDLLSKILLELHAEGFQVRARAEVFK